MTEREKYFEEARSWADDTRAVAARSRRVAWTVAGIACAAALFQAVAIALMMPLKTVEPVTLLVDRQTGYVQALNPLEPRRVGADAALTQSFLAQYVTAREGFDRATIGVDYRKVALWSADRARSGYLAAMPAANPASPFQRYPAGTVVTVRVKSVSRLQEGVALVRFDSQALDRNGRGRGVQPWISVVRFRYSDAPMSYEDRLVNPLGFQVTGYRRDAEAPPPVESAAVMAPARPAPVAPTAVPIATVRVVSPPATEAVERMSSVRVTTVAAASRPRPRAYARAVEPREVPINNIPLGSPLGPFGTQPGQASGIAQP